MKIIYAGLCRLSVGNSPHNHSKESLQIKSQ